MTYEVWKRYTAPGSDMKWTLTKITINARSDNEARKKLVTKFKNALFHSMSLIAVKKGTLLAE